LNEVTIEEKAKGRASHMSMEAFNRQIEALRAEYRAGLPDKLREIDGLWRGLADGALQPGSVLDLRRALHSLAGSARTFGVAGVSEAALAAETWIEPYCARPAVPGPAEQAVFQRLLDTLKQTAA